MMVCDYMNYDFSKIGKRIAKERKAMKLSQTDLIIKLNDNGVYIGRTTLSFIEGGKSNGSLTLDVLYGLCVVFGCEIGYLLGEQGYENKTKHTTNVTDETITQEKQEERINRGNCLEPKKTEQPKVFFTTEQMLAGIMEQLANISLYLEDLKHRNIVLTVSEKG